MTPVYLSIAGSDCSAGAGLQADLKAGFALGCYPLTAVTCVVSEVPGKVEGIVAMEPQFVADQVRICLQNFPVAAIKTGMLYSPEIVQAVTTVLAGYNGPLVVDPVMIATAGEALMLQAAISVYEQNLMPRTTLLTPNLDELIKLLGTTQPISTADDLQQAALQLTRRYNCAVLAKGGHLGGNTCTDILVQKDGTTHSWAHPRTLGISTHGTGCTLSSAIAAHLAHGHDLVQAVELSLQYITRAIASSHKLGELWAVNHHGE
ncbi:MAG: bifunctional hydroxymethylpyrimidine kinase/phosphomethylpyrimidine kinase [Akkermansiaceae bacterium]|nr:bifunctional hydroxymethylpyrimidine kinase/phosphomethylpyrimidine kinase [Akkermansiaceae bacterium]